MCVCGYNVYSKDMEETFLINFLIVVNVTFKEAMSDTLRWVCTVSNCSKHHSNSSIVSIAKRMYPSSPGAIARDGADG